MVKRNDARFIRSKAEKLSVTNASLLCENNKTYWVGAASGGMFFVGFSGGRGGGSGAILHNIVIGQEPVVVGFCVSCTITHIM